MTEPEDILVSTISEEELTHDERWQLVLRVVASRPFAKAGQLRELLLYVVRKALTVPASEFTEQEIGWRVLGRKHDYDPQEDTIVRVQMRHLRTRLEQYYATVGQDEPLLVTIPKGSYIPRFERRHGAEDPVPVVAEHPPASHGRRWLWIALGVVLAVAVFCLGRWSVRDDPAPNAFWSLLFAKDQPTSIVIADSSYVLIQDLLHTNLTLDDYVARSHRKLIDALGAGPFQDALKWTANRQYTSLADATMAGRLSVLGKQSGSKVAVRFSRHMNIREFNSGNFILVGSKRGNPWTQLFEPKLNFRFVVDGREVGFQNLRPNGSEPRSYMSTPGDGPYETYATLALLPNLTGNGNVLLLMGTTMEASEAAGEFTLRGDFPGQVASLTGTPAGGKLPYFELLLKIGAIAGAPSTVSVVAWRKPAI